MYTDCPGGCLLLGGVCSRGICFQEVSGLGGVCLGGLLLGGVWSGDVCSGGCLDQGGVCSGGYILACTEADPLPMNRMTDRCKNITLATTSLRPVIKENVQNSKQKVTKNKLLELMKRILKG